jgi:mercuric ion binding protein
MRTKVMMVMALAAILALGFGAASNVLAAEKTVKFKIPGCVWGDTSTQVRITAQRIDGVKSVDSNAVNQSATIVFDDTKTSVEAIKKELARAGYPPLGNPEIK